jgi:PhnB protein
MAFHPYLNFGGNCREAFTRYQEIFGGELVLLAMSDMPETPGSEPVPAEKAGLIAHAALTSGDQLLMGADDPTGGFDGHVRGMCVSVDATDVDHAHKLFAALTDGGETQMPLTETFFSPAFGMCIDRFGTPWMVVTAQPS